MLALTTLILITFTGCSSLLPTSKQSTDIPWKSYNEIQNAYKEITTYKTTKKELHTLGFDPYKTPNIKILNHLDILEKFLLSPSITIDDLDKGVQKCLKNEKRCTAYEINISDIRSKRYGNVFADLFNFRKNTLQTGWSFYSLVVLNNSTVVYKVSQCTPKINNRTETKNPLGPFQSMESVLRSAVD